MNFLTYLIREWAPTVLILGITIGSLLLWKRTKRISALAQLLTSTPLFLLFVLHLLRTFTTPFDSSLYSRFLWSPRLNDVESVVGLVCVVVFPIAYLCYAIREKPSNQAMQRTTPRSDA